MIHLLFSLLPALWQQLLAPLLPSLSDAITSSAKNRLRAKGKAKAKGVFSTRFLKKLWGKGAKTVLSMTFVGLTLISLALPFWWNALDWAAIQAVMTPKNVAKSGSECSIVKVTDGDSVRITCPVFGEEPARVMGYDTPEIFSPKCASEKVRGLAATEALRRMLDEAKVITIERHGREKYGRVLITLKVDGVDVAQKMVSAGHARVYTGARREGWCG